MTAVLAAVNERMRSRLTGNIGEDVVVSHHMNSGKLTTAATNSAMMVGRGPAPRVALDEREREAEEADAGDDHAGDVDAALGPLLALAAAG